MEAILMSMESYEVHKVDKALKQPSLVTIHCSHQVWESPDKSRRGHEVIIEHDKVLSKVTTFDDSLTKHGMTYVEFYKHPRTGARCIRKG